MGGRDLRPDAKVIGADDDGERDEAPVDHPSRDGCPENPLVVQWFNEAGVDVWVKAPPDSGGGANDVVGGITADGGTVSVCGEFTSGFDTTRIGASVIDSE
jgi:hypothetical protein